MQLLLFGMFLYLFGKPAVERYLDKKVIVVTSRREGGGTPAPALTIVVRRTDTGTGWKKETFQTKLFVESLCGDTDKNKSITDCFEENTFDLSEISQSVNLGLPVPGVSSNGVKDAWIEDFTYSFMGRTYTLNITKNLRYDSLADSLLRIGLEPNLTYDIFIHDPKYFYATRNPESEAPSVRKAVDPAKLSYYYSFALTEVEELDVPKDRCNNDPDYNFRTCVKESFSGKAGCKTKWDKFGHNNLQPCTTIQQFRCVARKILLSTDVLIRQLELSYQHFVSADVKELRRTSRDKDTLWHMILALRLFVRLLPCLLSYFLKLLLHCLLGLTSGGCGSITAYGYVKSSWRS